VDPGVLLEAVPQFQQVAAVAAQLAGHPGCRLTAGDAPQDHQDLRRATMCPLEEGLGPRVENPAATAALVVQDRLAMPAMDLQALPLTTLGTSQAIRVEEFDEFGVTGVLIQIVDHRKVHA
jgi:hypothetical protein